MILSGLSILGYNRGVPAGAANAVHEAASGAALQPGFYNASEAEVNRAAELAATAFTQYSKWPAVKRAELLRAIAQGLEANSSAIIERAMQESALPQPRLQGEMGRTCGQLRLFATLIEAGWWLDARIDHADPQRKPVPKPDVRSMLVALGPVAVFGASNFPLAFSVAGGDTAAALAAGCPVIVKAHEGHPGTSELVGLVIQQAARDAGAPEGVFSLLFGFREVGGALVRHPSVAAVGFTGSLRAGRALADLAAARPHPIPVYAEMGSVNPVFILKGALAQRGEEIAAGLGASVTLGVGQFCTNPGLVFLEGASTPFLNKLEATLAATAPGTMLTQNICTGYRGGLEKLAKANGVRQLTSVAAEGRQAGAALFVTDAAAFINNPALAEEVFGPVTLVVECATRNDLIAAARSLEGQLTATLQAAPEEFAPNSDLIAILETKAGRILCNGFPTGVEVCHAMNHGGPYPATSDGRSTSVGTRAITRFARPVCFQDFPEIALPDELKEGNPLNIPRLVDGKLEP